LLLDCEGYGENKKKDKENKPVTPCFFKTHTVTGLSRF
jgi:hypothetical protein